MKLIRTISNAFIITASIYLALIVLYFLAGFEFFPYIMFSPLGILSVFSLAFFDLIFITIG